jgi:F0F1-type ATP synthase assembly protein I
MKIVALTLVANISSAVCVIAAFILAYHDRGSWPWFLIVGCILHASVECKERGGK